MRVNFRRWFVSQTRGPGSRDYGPGTSVPWRVREIRRSSNDKGETPDLERNHSPLGPTGLGEGDRLSRAADAEVVTGGREFIAVEEAKLPDALKTLRSAPVQG